jgi:hypothetical protein
MANPKAGLSSSPSHLRLTLLFHPIPHNSHSFPRIRHFQARYHSELGEKRLLMANDFWISVLCC